MTHGLDTIKWMNSPEGQKELKKQKTESKRALVTGINGMDGSHLAD